MISAAPCCENLFRSDSECNTWAQAAKFRNEATVQSKFYRVLQVTLGSKRHKFKNPATVLSNSVFAAQTTLRVSSDQFPNVTLESNCTRSKTHRLFIRVCVHSTTALHHFSQAPIVIPGSKLCEFQNATTVN